MTAILGGMVALRPVTPADAATLAEILADPTVAPWWGNFDAERLRNDVIEPPPGVASFVIEGLHHGLVAAALSHEWGIAVRHGCFCANPYVFHLLHMSKDSVDAVENEVTAGQRKALPGAVRASLAPYNTQAEVDRFVDAVSHIARGRIKTTYEQSADGTFAPSGGWPRITSPLPTLMTR